MKYTAFISYSHAVDAQLAPALQSALQRFAKPWYQMRGLHVFRDDASLSINAALWPAIETALSESKYFVLLASPEAASSPWVQRELDFWLRQRPIERLLIVVTEGELVWDTAAQDFQWNEGTPLPPNLRGVFREEPRYLDLRWAHDPHLHLSLTHNRFMDSVADLAATLHGRSKDELIGEEVVQHRRMRLWRRGAIAALVLLVCATTGAAMWALKQQSSAEHRRDEALRTQSLFLADLSRQQVASGHSTTAIRLALEGLPKDLSSPDRPFVVETEGALLNAVMSSWEIAVLEGHTRGAFYAGFSPDDSLVVTVEYAGTARLWSTTDGSPRAQFGNDEEHVTYASFSPDGKRLVTGSEEGRVRVWDVATGQELFQLLPPPAARIGIQMGPVPEREAKAFGLAVGRGAVIKSVVAGSPAEAAGLRADDVITEVNGRPVDLKEGRPLLQNAPAGSIVEIRFLRDGQRLSTKATPELLQDDKASPVKVAIARFSPDGRWIVTADARVIMWDAETGAQIGTLYGHRSLIQRMEFCDGGTRLFTTAFDERPRVWDLSRMGELVSVDYTVLDKGVGTYGLMEATISRDCKFIATTSGGPTAVWNGQTGKLVRVLDNSYKVEFGPDSGVVATAGGWNATLWNTGSGEQVVLLFGHKADVLHATFSQSGRHLVTGSKDTTARVWDLRTGREVALLRGHDDRIEYAAFTHDGKTIVTLSDDKTARLWRFSGLEIPVANPTRHEFRPELEHLSQTGSRVVIPSRGDGVEVWHLDRAVPIVLQGHDGRAVHASISPDGRRVYTVTAHARRLWDADTGALIIQAERQESEPNVYMPRTDGVFSPDSRLVLTRSTDGQPELRNATTGESIELLQTPSHRPLATVFSEDGQRLATVGPGDVRVWSTKDGSPVAKLDMQRVENSFALSRNGSRLAVLVSGGVGLWDVDKAEQLATLTGHQRGIKRMVFSPNSRILVTVSEERARVWNANDGTLLFESTEVNPEISGGVAFSPDGSRLVIPGPKQTSHVVDPRTGDVVTVLEGHVAGASYVTFSRTGNRITTTSIDGTARLWDAETGVEFGKLGGENELTRQPNPFERKKSSSGFFPDLSFLEHAIVYAQFLPDGRRIFTVQASGDVRAFEVPETAELMALARKIARRALSDEERKQFFLAPAQGRTSERQSQKADQ